MTNWIDSTKFRDDGEGKGEGEVEGIFLPQLRFWVRGKSLEKTMMVKKRKRTDAFS